MCAAATSIGNEELLTKFNSACDLIKRDIAFATSLYLWNQMFVDVFLMLNFLLINTFNLFYYYTDKFYQFFCSNNREAEAHVQKLF